MADGRFLIFFFTHVSHPDQCAARPDCGRCQRVWRSHHCSAPLGTLLPALFRRARRGLHAGYRARRDGPGERSTPWLVPRFSDSWRILARALFRAHCHPAFPLWRRNPRRRIRPRAQGLLGSDRPADSHLLRWHCHRFGISSLSGAGLDYFRRRFSPQDSGRLTVSSVMLASGRSRGFAWGASVMLGMATVAGVMTMAVFRHEVSFGLPLSAGVTIYVAASDLIPEVNKEPGVKMALLVFVGAACMFLLDRFFHVH